MFKNGKSIILLLTCIIIIFPTNIFAERHTIESNLEDLYRVNIDDKEWIELESTEEMFEATQISMGILKNLSTEDLLELALKHPLAISILAYDDIDDGIEFLSENSNVFQELSSRDDKVNVLINKLKMNSRINDKIKISNLYEKSEDEIIEDLLITCLLSSTDYSEKLSQEDLQILKELEDDKAIAPYVLIDSVPTPKGTRVSVLVRGEELSSSQKSSINSRFDKSYPNATRLRTATTNYNCHSYAWHSTSNSNPFWMDDPSPYWSDGSYIKKSTCKSGYKAYYYNGPHSGIVTKIYSGASQYSDRRDLVEITSKWGEAGLYRHKGNYSPYSNGLRYYN